VVVASVPLAIRSALWFRLPGRVPPLMIDDSLRISPTCDELDSALLFPITILLQLMHQLPSIFKLSQSCVEYWYK
jgi:hypothetical protein